MTLRRWDRDQVGAEMVRDGRGAAVYSASGNAIKAIAAKQPEELTREDAMTAACDMVPMCAIITRGTSCPSCWIDSVLLS
eukprot:COSAG06_NODE_181_length_20926_cov_7.590051_17_plen_80_part_00